MRKTFLFIIATVWSLGMLAGTPAMETAYNRLLVRFEQRDGDLQNELKTYLQQYPYSTYKDEIHFMSGVLYAEKGKWKNAAKALEQADYKALSRPHQPDYQFYRGYTNLMLQEYERAITYFSLLRKSSNPYTQKATYYYAYCQYKLKRYEKALPALLSLENAGDYQATVPYFIVQSYYAQGDLVETQARAEALLADPSEDANRSELHRMLGEIYYRKGDYKKAVTQLKAYEQAAGEEVPLVRNDIYLLGMAEYLTGAYQEAVKYLKQVQQQRDTVSESTCLTLGNAYRTLGQQEQAKLSYQAAMAYQLTPRVTEEARYNYTLCTYESSTALGESVKAFTSFLKDYPNSPYKDRIFTLLGDAFMRSKNYQAALNILDSIRTDGLASDAANQLLATKQYLRYQLGVDAFLQGKTDRARDCMTEVLLRPGTIRPDLTTEAYYWRAEANYRLHDYEACARDLEQYFAQPNVRRSANYPSAPYLSGYAYFSMRRYSEAEKQFVRYIDQAQTTDPTYADAINRLGDCAFNARNFTEAIAYYGQVLELNATGADYATFQKGYAQGLLRKYRDKIATLRTLVSRYPKSDYADDGLYEIARAQLQLDDDRAAITSYETLLTDYPNSNLGRKASLERAMLYGNLHQTEQAIDAYKETIRRYPATDEAYAALDALEALYVTTNNIAEYLAYTKQLSKVNMHITTADDSLSYAAAELQYIQGNYAAATSALSDYLTHYCAGGRYCTIAQYQLADAYYRLARPADALREYRLLSDIAGNPYMEEACMRVAELSYDAADYATALDYFYRMLSLASSAENTDIARLGILRTSYFLGQHRATIDIATQILDDYAANSEKADVIAEAMYNRAKAYIALGQWDKAQADLTALAQEVRTANGAEAKYLLAEAYFRDNDLDAAEAEIMSFAQMNTQQQYWLARALILLADINTSRGDTFQAQQYLLSLRENYRPASSDDDIPARIKERLTITEEAAETPEQQTAEEE